MEASPCAIDVHWRRGPPNALFQHGTRQVQTARTSVRARITRRASGIERRQRRHKPTSEGRRH
jgi:hypothetical protein